jgi:hypothetical protein
MTRRRAQSSEPKYRILPLTQVRSSLSPLVRELSAENGSVGIAVHGEVCAYLVGAEAFRELRLRAGAVEQKPSKLRGSVEILGDLEEGSREAADELVRSPLSRPKAR